MKRLALLAFTAGFFWSGLVARADEPQMAPTVPQVPAPLLSSGTLVPAGPGAPAGYDFRTASGPVCVPETQKACSGSKWSRFNPLAVFNRGGKGCEPYDDCAPAVRHPLPPLPGGVGGNCPGGTCMGGGSRGGLGLDLDADGSCWRRFKGWLCYRPTPIHLGCTPTARHVPVYQWFPCESGAGCGPAGCAAPRVAAASGPTIDAARLTGLPARGISGGSSPCPTPGEEILPGYRLANPERPSVVGKPVGQLPVETSSYKQPVPAAGVPYKPATTNPVPSLPRP